MCYWDWDKGRICVRKRRIACEVFVPFLLCYVTLLILVMFEHLC